MLSKIEKKYNFNYKTMSEFAPAGSNARMTKSQIKKYIADMKKAQLLAEIKLQNAQKNGDFLTEEEELAELQKKLEDIV